LLLVLWTALLFLRFGFGTPAPWDPPAKFVVKGPYRHVRNPMIVGVWLALLGETVWFWSFGVAVWWAVFMGVNALYIPLREEKGLERRFGEAYREYKRCVPRWVPRMTAWPG
jgi:protein-S-isoprenylcysteine O-methyltransferase Ste14